MSTTDKLEPRFISELADGLQGGTVKVPQFLSAVGMQLEAACPHPEEVELVVQPIALGDACMEKMRPFFTAVAARAFRDSLDELCDRTLLQARAFCWSGDTQRWWEDQEPKISLFSKASLGNAVRGGIKYIIKNMTTIYANTDYKVKVAFGVLAAAYAVKRVAQVLPPTVRSFAVDTVIEHMTEDLSSEALRTGAMLRGTGSGMPRASGGAAVRVRNTDHWSERYDPGGRLCGRYLLALRRHFWSYVCARALLIRDEHEKCDAVKAISTRGDWELFEYVRDHYGFSNLSAEFMRFGHLLHGIEGLNAKLLRDRIIAICHQVNNPPFTPQELNQLIRATDDLATNHHMVPKHSMLGVPGFRR